MYLDNMMNSERSCQIIAGFHIRLSQGQYSCLLFWGNKTTAWNVEEKFKFHIEKWSIIPWSYKEIW